MVFIINYHAGAVIIYLKGGLKIFPDIYLKVKCPPPLPCTSLIFKIDPPPPIAVEFFDPPSPCVIFNNSTRIFKIKI